MIDEIKQFLERLEINTFHLAFENFPSFAGVKQF